MSEPKQTCTLCGRFVVAVPNGRGFAPDTARRKLAKLCKANGCPSQPRYTAGLNIGPAPRETA